MLTSGVVVVGSSMRIPVPASMPVKSPPPPPAAQFAPGGRLGKYVPGSARRRHKLIATWQLRVPCNAGSGFWASANRSTCQIRGVVRSNVRSHLSWGPELQGR